MFDIGGPELLAIAIVAIIVIGPKELPAAIRTVTLWIRKARGLAAEFRAGVDEMVREAEFDHVKEDIEKSLSPEDLANTIKDELDPDGEIGDTFDFDEDTDWYSPEEEQYDMVAEDNALPVGEELERTQTIEDEAAEAEPGQDPVASSADDPAEEEPEPRAETGTAS